MMAAAFLFIAGILFGTVIYGSRRWDVQTQRMRSGLATSSMPLKVNTYDPGMLEGLPPPVQRYFRAVLPDHQPMIASVHVEHTGTFNMSETGEQWRPFTSTQHVVTCRPGFDWDARIRMAPGLAVRVHDAYIAGEGILHAALFGLVPVVRMRGNPDLARGELMRFCAEAAWYPTALLPVMGVRWREVDETSAEATMEDGTVSLSMLFRFGGNGLIESVRADARGRTVGGRTIPTPWEGRWSSYERRRGMLIPLEGEVRWMLPEGPKPYWRGRITNIVYELAR